MKLVVISIVSATLANGLLAGGDVDRWVLAMPAWQSVGVVGWANYSRLADLGNGFVLGYSCSWAKWRLDLSVRCAQ